MSSRTVATLVTLALSHRVALAQSQEAQRAGGVLAGEEEGDVNFLAAQTSVPNRKNNKCCLCYRPDHPEMTCLEDTKAGSGWFGGSSCQSACKDKTGGYYHSAKYLEGFENDYKKNAQFCKTVKNELVAVGTVSPWVAPTCEVEQPKCCLCHASNPQEAPPDHQRCLMDATSGTSCEEMCEHHEMGGFVPFEKDQKNHKHPMTCDDLRGNSVLAPGWSQAENCTYMIAPPKCCMCVGADGDGQCVSETKQGLRGADCDRACARVKTRTVKDGDDYSKHMSCDMAVKYNPGTKWHGASECDAYPIDCALPNECLEGAGCRTCVTIGTMIEEGACGWPEAVCLIVGIAEGGVGFFGCLAAVRVLCSSIDVLDPATDGWHQWCSEMIGIDNCATKCCDEDVYEPRKGMCGDDQCLPK